jgi:hypothetical protein
VNRSKPAAKTAGAPDAARPNPAFISYTWEPVWR